MGGIGIGDGNSLSLSRLRMYTGIQGKHRRDQRHLQNIQGGELCGLVFAAYAVSYLKEKQSSYVAFSYALVFD